MREIIEIKTCPYGEKENDEKEIAQRPQARLDFLREGRASQGNAGNQRTKLDAKTS